MSNMTMNNVLSSEQQIKLEKDSRQSWGIVMILGAALILLLLFTLLFKNLVARNLFIYRIITFMPVLFTLIITYYKQKNILKQSVSSFKIDYWHRYIYFAIIVSGIVLISNTIISLFKFASIPVRLEIISSMSRLLTIYSFISIVVLLPILEEILFRGVILKGFLASQKPTKAIIITSVLFSLYHLNPLQFINAFFLSIFLSWYYFKNSNVLSCIIIHSISNLVGFFLIKYYIIKAPTIAFSRAESIFFNSHLLLIFLLAISLIVLGMIGLRRSLKN